jgi:HEPN domain-containing protein
MNTDVVEKEVLEFDGVRRSIEEIKSMYPDEWILIGDPEEDENGWDVSGIVLYHGRDKMELAYRDKPLIKEYSRISSFFNRVTPRTKEELLRDFLERQYIKHHLNNARFIDERRTKEEHIDYWVKNAEKDWERAEEAFMSKKYLHCLSWAHQTLEELAKALWVKNNPDNIPPRLHDILNLLEQAGVEMDAHSTDFLEMFNKYRVVGRDSDYINNIRRQCTQDFTRELLDKANTARQCLIIKTGMKGSELEMKKQSANYAN